MMAILEIVLTSTNGQLDWKLYLLDKFLCAMAESAVYGASDKNLDWNTPFLSGLKLTALRYAELADKVFMSLKRKEWRKAKEFSAEMDETSSKARTYVKAHHDCPSLLETDRSAKTSVDMSSVDMLHEQTKKSRQSGSKKRKYTDDGQ